MNNFGDKNIFVSYRRDDSTGDTFQLVKSLKQYIHEKRIFLDSEKLEPGEDFPKRLRQSLKQCDIVIVVIGKNWLSPKQDGSPSLMNEANWVRIEVAIALKQNKLVIPLLLNGTAMPGREQLPEILQTLTNKQASEIYYRTWDNDIKDLVTFLKKTGVPFKEDESQKNNIDFTFSKWTFFILVALTVSLYFLFQFFFHKTERIPSPSEIYSLNNKKPDLRPLNRTTVLPAVKYNIAGIWKVENIQADRYYKIVTTLQGSSLQIWSNGSLETTGTVTQKDSLVKMSYRDKRAGIVNINAILIENGQKLSGTRTLGSAFKIEASIKIDLIRKN